ncbi:MAG: secondary thiamine-phosphate synthase enzyme YjbQ [Candidatus Thorarchaeota archaeon]
MSVYHERISFETKGDCDIIDITSTVEKTVKKSEIQTGICTIFCTGSTGSITTIEFESGLLEDFPVAMERIAPKNAVYQHHLRWRDGNGHSHIRASILGPSLTIPFLKGKLTLGTWQQIVFVDFDNRPRSRQLEVMLIGD